jgi:hypothetical protein
MPELPDPADAATPVVDAADLLDRLRRAPGLASLVAEAQTTWRARVHAARDEAGTARVADGDTDPGPDWRAFADAFPTFWEFTNRPR